MPFINPAGSIVRYRVRLSRLGPARELTHLAQIEALRRAVQASGLPAAMDGRKRRPRPRLSFGPAISVGYESLAEYFDMELTRVRPTIEIASALSKALEQGFSVCEVRRIPAFFPSLEASINVARYEVEGSFPPDAPRSIEKFMAREEIIVEKVKQGGALIERVNARPLILRMGLVSPDRLELTLRFGPKRTVKPEALLQEWLQLKSPAAAGAAVSPGVARGRPPLADILENYRILRKDLLSETGDGELLAP